jgi:formylglycine-generating enzyme required for sulfatase activity
MRFEKGSWFAGKYRIDALLGKGGFGEVYRVTNQLGQVWALKVLVSEVARDPGVQKSFLREMDIARGLLNPHAVPVRDADIAEGCLYYTMEVIEGRPVRDIIAAEGAIAPARAVDWLIQLLEFLEFLHDDTKTIHRDLKPANIVVEMKDGCDFLRVLDLGIARSFAIVRGNSSEQHTLTVEQGAIGTPLYMAPEQHAADPTMDERVDLWAAGVILYECLTAQRPFATVADIFQKRAAPVHVLRPGVSQKLWKVLERALDPDRERRFTSAREFREALEAAISIGKAPSGRGKAVWIGATLAAALAIAGAIWALTRPDENAELGAGSGTPEAPLNGDGSGRGDPSKDAVGREGENVDAASSTRVVSESTKGAVGTTSGADTENVKDSALTDNGSEGTRNPVDVVTPPKDATAPRLVDWLPAPAAPVQTGSTLEFVVTADEALGSGAAIIGPGESVEDAARLTAIDRANATRATRSLVVPEDARGSFDVEVVLVDAAGNPAAPEERSYAAFRVPQGLEAAPGAVPGVSAWASRVIEPRTRVTLELVPPTPEGGFRTRLASRSGPGDETSVVIEYPYYLGRSEVSWADLDRLAVSVAEAKPLVDGLLEGYRTTIGSEPELRTLPVGSLTWPEARDLCSHFGSGFRLPREFEFEWAARRAAGAALDAIDAEFPQASVALALRPVEEGARLESGGATFLGLGDNMSEWCVDPFEGRPVSTEPLRFASPALIPAEIETGTGIVGTARGSSFKTKLVNQPLSRRFGYRFPFLRENAQQDVGFRLCLPLAPESDGD